MKVIAREELYEASTAETAADRVTLAPELTETVGWLDSHAERGINSLATAYHVFSCTIAFCSCEIPCGNRLAETTCHAMPFDPGVVLLRTLHIVWPTAPPSKS
jgi:hypothetical protein